MKFIRALVVGALLVFGQGGLSSAASPSAAAPETPPANGTLTVQPPLISLSVNPGDTATTELSLHAGVQLSVKIAAEGLGQGPDGGFNPLAADQDKSPYSARSMLTFDPQSFQMQPGGTHKVKVTMTVPKDAGQGTRYALLKITGIPGTGSENVGIGVELGVTSLVALAKTTQTRLGALQDLAVARPAGKPLVATGQLMNTGNSHYGAQPDQVYTWATLQNSSGLQLATNRITLSGNSLVPTFDRRFSVPLVPGQPLADGSYHVEVEAGLQDGTVLDRAALDFSVSGGAVLGATSAPLQPLPEAGGGSANPLLLLLILLIGAIIGALLVSRISRRRRPTDPPATL